MRTITIHIEFQMTALQRMYVYAKAQYLMYTYVLPCRDSNVVRVCFYWTISRTRSFHRNPRFPRLFFESQAENCNCDVLSIPVIVPPPPTRTVCRQFMFIIHWKWLKVFPPPDHYDYDLFAVWSTGSYDGLPTHPEGRGFTILLGP
jgi:hypothetical protein